MERHTFHANGKLLITGEYLVMQGALALAVPTRFGQGMDVYHGIPENENTGIQERVLEWRSYYKGECWFECSFLIPDLQILKTSNTEKAGFILKLLSEANKLNPDTLNDGHPILVETRLEFSPDWGLGSSSTLISLLSEWFDIDPQKLFRKTQQGSGYDIACARSDTPIWYRLVLGSPIIQPVVFNPEFNDRIAFVYSGEKQDSAVAISTFLQKNKNLDARERISQIGRDIGSAGNLDEFNSLVNEHETIMSEILELPKVKEQRFPDFPGSIKSLGAWGGDFIMASSEIGYNGILSYFSRKGLHTAFAFDDIVRR
ncbi:MAG: GYDIA family GHMP kinase [Bacteroidales bacterium]|nr:GYDIA family GHMP kinase [Bacteroidales bacterium]